MKKFTLLLILILIFVSLCGCADKDFVKATNGDFSVSISNDASTDESSAESTEPEPLSEEAKPFVGVWRLKTIADGGYTTSYTNSYYIFNPDGTYSLTVDGQSNTGRFAVADNTIFFGNTPSTFIMDGKQLTFITRNGKTHTLTKIQESN